MREEILSYKQRRQLRLLCEEFNPYCKQEGVMFLEIISEASRFCDPNFCPSVYKSIPERFDTIFKEGIKKIIDRYFYNTPKMGKVLSWQQYNEIGKITKGTELFIKLIRACLDYVRSGFSENGKLVLMDKLGSIFFALGGELRPQGTMKITA